MEAKEIVNIGLEHIHPHPDNPRKDLGDLTELAESIKKNGILQNLTVIPKEGEPGEYIAIIGHRRSAAAKLAGITEAPCRIVEGMTHKEQVSTMLEENMQRGDLTIWEQAQGFQMMLDLGETEDTIAEKTGFSKKTIRHRLNIAKLDSKTLMEKERQDGYQLTLTDMYELEKIKDIKAKVFIEGILSGRIKKVTDEKQVEADLFEQMMDWETFTGHNKLIEFFVGCEVYNAPEEEKEAAHKKMQGLSVLQKLLCLVSAMVADADLVEWNYTYNTVRGEKVKAFYGILEQYGFQFPNDEEKGVVEGTSDLYVKKEGAK